MAAHQPTCVQIPISAAKRAAAEAAEAEEAEVRGVHERGHRMEEGKQDHNQKVTLRFGRANSQMGTTANHPAQPLGVEAPPVIAWPEMPNVLRARARL